MSAKLFIDVKKTPKFTDRVNVSFDLNKRSKHIPHLLLNDKTKKWESPPYGFLTFNQEKRYWYEDEWFDGNLIGVLKGYDEIKTVWHDFEYDWDFTQRLDFLKDLSKLSDNQIFNYLNNLWYRPVPFWKMYRILVKDYLLAKRDYLKSLVRAEIIDIHIMAVYVPPDKIHKKMNKGWH